MAGFSQNDHLLRIDTILNDDPAEKKFEGDPLLLTKVDGTEGISRLFAYDVVMLRDAGGFDPAAEKRPPIDTTKLIGTHAVFGIRPSNDKDQEEDTIFFKRVGYFEAFEDFLEIDITHQLFFFHQRDFHIYRARVVPWVKVLSRDICYRIFEQKSVVEIIDAVADEARKVFPQLIIDTSALKDPKFPPFPPMEYCVQYGESTLEFISRLMQRFGIWYFFGHRASGPNFVLNEAMILKRQQDSSISQSGLGDVKIEESGPGVREISKLVRRFRPPERRMVVGGFNYLDPTNPFYKDGTVSPSDDLLRTEGGPPSQSKFSSTTAFATPVFSDTEAEAYAKTVTSRNESEVLLISGVTKNHGFVSGHSFRIVKHDDFDPEDNLEQPFADVVDKNFVIDLLAVTANDYEYVNLRPDVPVIGDAFEAVFHTLSALEADAIDDSDNALYKASLWATRTAQAMVYSALNPLYGNFPDTAAGTDITVAGLISPVLEAGGAALDALKIPGIGADLAKVLPAIGSVVDFKKALMDGKNVKTMAIGVIAVPEEAPFDPPLPQAARPLARGPHTAVVIGPDGTDTSKQHIFADSIGRVRVRFPWDPGPPEGRSKLPPAFPVTQPDKPTKKGQNTGWVRVVEGWAGRQFGTQFLPRIGQEVLVDFLDGDPDRPIITGRLYNADRGFANIPFPQGQVEVEQVEQKDLANAIGFTDYRFVGLKTSSFPKPNGAKERYHLERFDETFNCEQWLIRSQGRLDVTAFAHSFETTHGNKHVRVVEGRDKDNKPFGGSEFITVGGEYDLHVGGARYEGIDKANHLTVKADTIFDLQTNHHTRVGTESTLNAKSIVIEAPIKITLKVGNSFVVVDPAGVWIQGPVVMINSGGAPGVTADVEIIDPVDAQAAEPGDQWNKRLTTCDPHPRGGGGGRRGRTVKAKHGLAVTANPDGSLQVGPGIRVSGGDPAYRDAVINDLATMDQTTSGHALIDSLNTSGHQTTITPLVPPQTPSNAFASPTNVTEAAAPGSPERVDGAGNPIVGPPAGSDSTLQYNPGDWPDPTYRTNPPGDVVLFHEMKHAEHNAQGTRDMTPRADGFHNQEEFNTIQDENQYRDERGHPRRTDHTDL